MVVTHRLKENLDTFKNREDNAYHRDVKKNGIPPPTSPKNINMEWSLKSGHD
jgi:hypothetical protein